MKRISAEYNAHILVVDDYIVNQELTKEMLEMMKCEVDVAEDGNEAISLYKEGKYDLIFMDVQMPGMDGYDVTRQIRIIESGKEHTPIIAITANALVGDREKCLEAGMDDYISKPIKGSDLEMMLDKYLSKQKVQ